MSHTCAVARFMPALSRKKGDAADLYDRLKKGGGSYPLADQMPSDESLKCVLSRVLSRVLKGAYRCSVGFTEI